MVNLLTYSGLAVVTEAGKNNKEDSIMGLFGPSSLEERIMQIIEKQEKVLQKWPCMLGEDDYYILWDMYLGGITEYNDPKFLYMIEPLENL